MRAAIYTRISDDDGSAKGVARQEVDCRAEAERRGWEVATVYQDNDVSATRSKVRPSYQRMLTDIRAGIVDALIVWDIDRLTRTPREIEDMLDLADQTGLVLVNVTGSGDFGTDDGRMMLRIKGAFAKREVEQSAKRLRRKLLEKATNGEPHGRAPYGYRREDGRDVVVPQQAEVIREAVGRILAGQSLRSVATDFNKRDVASPSGAPWVPATLRQVIKRPAIAGLRQYQGKVAGKSTADPIIDADTHERLTALFADPTRKSNHAGREPKYLLSGIAICGRCGGIMKRAIGHTNTLANGVQKKQPPSYVCGDCHKVRRIQSKVDELVEAVIVARLAQPDIASQLFTSGNPEAAREARDNIATVDAKLANAADQFADDTITADQLKRITARLRDERARLEAVLRSATPTLALAEFTHGDVAAKWMASPIEVKRLIVETIMRVTIRPSGSGSSFDPENVVIEWLAQ
ncbi:MAG TPA: recombinase family protein [Galbitalea sp.]|jgi:DNA invertase Pin-like site-specific DNA recombinase